MNTSVDSTYRRAWSNRWARRLNAPISLLRQEYSKHPGEPRVAIDAARKVTREASERPNAH